MTDKDRKDDRKEPIPKRSGYRETLPRDEHGDRHKARPSTPHEPQNDPAHKPKPNA